VILGAYASIHEGRTVEIDSTFAWPIR
jgi:hypothetical protein